MAETKFFVITDTHFFKNSLGAYGKEYIDFMRFEQKCFAETEAINKAVFSYLEQAKQADTVLIAGDLSFNGEYESHLAFIKLLKGLKAAGKRIFVITADHDFKDEPFAFDKTGRLNPKGTKREELYELYHEFGFDEAIVVDKKHLSYVADLSDDVRLLALNNDYPSDGRYFDEQQIQWIKEQCKKARQDGKTMIAMNHYPLLAGQPIFSVVPSATQKHSGDVTTLLANEGVHLVFTGHMHNQAINVKTTDEGNKIFDVCTGSIIACPAVMRLVSIEDNMAKISSIPIPDFDYPTGEKTCKQYLSDLFDNMILNMLDDMQTNPYNLLRRFGAGDKKNLFGIVKFLGKLLNTLTISGVCRMLCIKCDKSIKRMLLRDYAVELVRGVFEGNQTFKKGTPKGDVFVLFVKRIAPILNKIDVKTVDGIKADLSSILINTAGNYDIDDWNATLKLV